MGCLWKQGLFKVVAKWKVDEGTQVMGEEQLLVDMVNVLDFILSGGPNPDHQNELQIASSRLPDALL